MSGNFASLARCCSAKMAIRIKRRLQLRAMLTHSAADMEIDFDLAQVFQQNKRYEDAEAALAQAENLATRRLPNARWSGSFAERSMTRQKKFDQAEEQFKRVLAENPHNARCAELLSDTCWPIAACACRKQRT